MAISPTDTIRPGISPAANSPATDTFMMKAYRIMMPDGGMIGPITEEAAVTAAAKRRE